MESYIGLVIEELCSLLDGDAIITEVEIVKNNDTVRRGLRIKSPKLKEIEPVFYFDDYGYYLEPVDIAKNIFEDYILHASGMPVEYFSDLFNYNELQNSILPVLVNLEKNKRFFENVPYEALNDDLAYYFRIDLGDGKFTAVNYNLLATWGKTFRDIKDDAKINFQNECSCLRCWFDRMYILSNKEILNGARRIMDLDFIKKKAEELESDLYFLPSSIHEWIMLKSNPILENKSLLGTVNEVNSTVVIAEEFLSDNIYFYSKEEGQFYMVTIDGEMHACNLQFL